MDEQFIHEYKEMQLSCAIKDIRMILIKMVLKLKDESVADWLGIDKENADKAKILLIENFINTSDEQLTEGALSVIRKFGLGEANSPDRKECEE